MLTRAHKESKLLTVFNYWHARAEGRILTQSKDAPVFLKKTAPEASTLFSSVRELFLSGGGGAGRALPAAIEEASRAGLDLKKVNVIVATSVGSILGLGIAMGLSPKQLHTMLAEMPAEQFQDWSLSSLKKCLQQWALCDGKGMPDYFRAALKKYTGLDDPSFAELYQKTGKEFRVIVTNLSQKKMDILSHKTTPHEKVANSVALSCGLPVLYPPQWRQNEAGEWDLCVDGGLIKGYPWGVGSSSGTPLEEQLGFVFINRTGAAAFNQAPVSPIVTIKDYLKNILTMFVFRNVFDMPDSIKSRTVTIGLNWNPLKFTATKEEQEGLNQAGQDGVRQFIERTLKAKEDVHVSKPGISLTENNPTLTYQYQTKVRNSNLQLSLETQNSAPVLKKR